MINRIRTWIEVRNDRLRLEQMNDRLLADIGVERADIRYWMNGEVAPASESATPLSIRLRYAATAFMRELRPVAAARQRAVQH